MAMPTDGMPSTRFWNFEDNNLSLPDISAEGLDDLLKLLITDFMLVHSNAIVKVRERSRRQPRRCDAHGLVEPQRSPAERREHQDGRHDPGERERQRYRSKQRRQAGRVPQTHANDGHERCAQRSMDSTAERPRRSRARHSRTMARRCRRWRQLS